MRVVELTKRFILNPKREIVRYLEYPSCRWMIVGFAFTGINLILIFLFVEKIQFNLPLATILSAEICTLLRFFVNDWWVFKQKGTIIKKLIHFHIANAGSFFTWWISANLLSYLGVNYLASAVAAICVSITVSYASNFFWVWRKRIHITNYKLDNDSLL